jgi:hypothetical protein
MPDDLSDEMLADRIRALLEERAAVGTTDPARTANINRELRRFGHQGEPPVKRAAKRTRSSGAKR